MARIQNQLTPETVEAANDLANKWGIPEHDQKHLFDILKNHLPLTDDIDSLGFDSIVNDGISLYKTQAKAAIARMDIFEYKNKLREAVLEFADEHSK